MPRIYTAQFTEIAVTTPVDFFEFAPVVNRPIELIGLFISQHTEVATNVGRDEFVRTQIIRGYATSGSAGGTATTAVPVEEFDTTAGFAVEVCNATLATGGTPVILHAEAWNVRTGFGMVWPSDTGPQCSAAANRLVVRLTTAPSESITFTATAYLREL